MKLNNDLIRDLLLTVEDEIDYTSVMTYNNPSFDVNNFSRLKSYSYEEIRYHISQCSFNDLISIGLESDDFVTITDLTPKGHSFVANIRNDNIWGKIKDVASSIGSKSLDAVIQISSNVITELIKHHFKLS